MAKTKYHMSGYEVEAIGQAIGSSLLLLFLFCYFIYHVITLYKKEKDPIFLTVIILSCLIIPLVAFLIFYVLKFGKSRILFLGCAIFFVVLLLFEVLFYLRVKEKINNKTLDEKDLNNSIFFAKTGVDVIGLIALIVVCWKWW